jgi:hypothetical protein
VKLLDRDVERAAGIKKRINGRAFTMGVAASCCLPTELIITVKLAETKKKPSGAANGATASYQLRVEDRPRENVCKASQLDDLARSVVGGGCACDPSDCKPAMGNKAPSLAAVKV